MFCKDLAIRNYEHQRRPNVVSPRWRSPLPKFTVMMPHHPTDYFAAEEAMMARMPYRHISRSIRPRQAPLPCVRRAA